MMRATLLYAVLLITALPAAAGQWSTGTYVYDGSGNITSVGPNSDNKTDLYRYDAFGRLKTSTAQTPTNANSQTFTYDPYGNLQLIDTVGDVSRFMPVNPATNHIDGTGTPPPGSSVVSASYDEAGNQIWLNGTYHYTYDALGRMISLTAGSRVERYLYDADDQRIATVYGGTPQRWRYTLRDLDGHFVREYVDDITGSIHNWRWTRDYLYAEGRLYGTIVVSERTGGESRQHFHLDHLGTPRLITDDGGALLSRHTLQPFGPEAIGSTRDSEVIKFTGHERDYAGVGDTNDLDYMHARYYGPGWGRFLTVDPTLDVRTALRAPETWNRYAYARNSPLRFTDPDGRIAIADDVVVGAAIGVVILTAYVQAPSVAVPGKTNGQVLVQSAIDGFQALGRAIGSKIPGRQPTTLPPPPPPTRPAQPSTPGTQPTAGVNPVAPIQAHVVNTTQGPVTIPSGYTSRPADNGKGTVYQAPGATGNADMIRVMDPTPRYPDGYVRIYNKHGQPTNIDGKPLGPAETHLPIVK